MRYFLVILLLLAQVINAYGYSDQFRINDAPVQQYVLSIGSETYNLEFPIQGQSDLRKLDIIGEDIIQLFHNLKTNDTYYTGKKLSGNSLSNFRISSYRKIKLSSEKDPDYFFGKYLGINTNTLLDNNLTPGQSDDYARRIVNGLYGPYITGTSPSADYDELIGDLSEHIYNFRFPASTIDDFADDLAFIDNQIGISISNLQKEYRNRFTQYLSTPLGRVNLYVGDFSYDNYETKRQESLNLLDNNIQSGSLIINAKFDSTSYANYRDNLLGKGLSYDNYFPSDYNQAFILRNKRTALQDELSRVSDNIRQQILQKYVYFANLEIANGDRDVTGNEGLTLSGGVVTFTTNIGGRNYTVSSNDTDNIKYFSSESKKNLFNPLEFTHSKSQEIISFINEKDREDDLSKYYPIDFAYNIAKNIDSNSLLGNNNGLLNYISTNFSNYVLSQDLLIDSVFPSITNSFEDKTFKTIQQTNFTQSDIDLLSSNFLLNKKIENFFLALANSSSVSENTILPFAANITSEEKFKNTLKGEVEGTQTLSKQYFSNTPTRTNSEGIKSCQLSYNPSIITRTGILGNTIIIKDSILSTYLDSNLNSFSNPLSLGKKYKVTLRSLDGDNENVQLNLLKSDGIRLPIMLSGKYVITSSGKINTSLEDRIMKDESENALYINGVIQK